MSIIERARQALNLVREGRTALAAIADSVRDGTAAVSTDDQAELNRMLEEEKRESREAHDSLEAAIAEKLGEG